MLAKALAWLAPPPSALYTGGISETSEFLHRVQVAKAKWVRPYPLPSFDYRPRRAYTHENGLAATISGLFWSSHQLGRDADARRSQHRHRVHLRFFHSNDHPADFPAGIHGAVPTHFRFGSLVRYAAAVCLAI